MSTAPAQAPGTNLAIVAAVVAMPLVVAAGFLTDRLAETPAAPVLWPELRGTFDPASGMAAAAPLRSAP